MPAAGASLWASPITLPAQPPGDPGQVFVLQDYRWVPVIVRRTPVSIECSFQVVTGASTVRAELLSERDFFLFARHREYRTLASTQIGRAGAFQRLVETPGRYRLLIRNERGAPPVAVSLLVRTELDPLPAALSGGVPPGRRFAVILASLAFFSATVWLSGRGLLRAYRKR